MSKHPKRHNARRDRLRPCEHGKTTPGPRIPLRYGSAPTEVCVECGAWRTKRHVDGVWSHNPMPVEEDSEA